jgi:hypothetical protein
MDAFDYKKYLKENNLVKEDGEFQRKYQGVRGTIFELAKNRSKLIGLYAQLTNNNKYIRKMYEAMVAMIDQGRDNIASNWKEDLARLEGEHLDLMSQINGALEREKLLKEKIR